MPATAATYCRVAVAVADNLATRRVRRVARITNGAQSSAVQKRTVIQVKKEDRRIGRDRIDLLDRRQALFGELVFGEATYNAHPLRCRSNRHLPHEHIHCIGQRSNTVPA